ncbi:hypothetical protein [Nostoc sp.]
MRYVHAEIANEYAEIANEYAEIANAKGIAMIATMPKIDRKYHDRDS